MMVLGILAGFFVARFFAPRFNISKSDIENAFVWIVMLGFIGARIYSVVFSWEYYSGSLIDIFKVWKGGLGIHGAVIGGIIGALVYAKIKKINYRDILSVFILGLPLGQAIGRLGNFFNQEAFGIPTDLPWKMYVAPFYRPIEFLNSQFFHPTFLYESLWNLVVFAVLLIIVFPPSHKGEGNDREDCSYQGKGIKKENSFPLVREVWWGGVIAYYFILYPLGRFFIEGLRTDSAYISSFRVDQISALVMICLGIFIILAHIKRKNGQNQNIEF